jgi:hypothetical protein
LLGLLAAINLSAPCPASPAFKGSKSHNAANQPPTNNLKQQQGESSNITTVHHTTSCINNMGIKQ